MIRSRRRLLAGSLAAIPLALTAFRANAQTTTLKISHQFPGGTIDAGDFRDRLVRKFAQDVEKRTNGALKFDIYPNSSLVKVNSQFSALRRGALDFLRKPFGEDDLLQRVNEALKRATEVRDVRKVMAEVQTHFETLSPREKEVFERIASGQANKFVAAELGISERTVEIHRSQVMRKMGARSLAQLVRMKIDLDTDATH